MILCYLTVLLAMRYYVTRSLCVTRLIRLNVNTGIHLNYLTYKSALDCKVFGDEGGLCTGSVVQTIQLFVPVDYTHHAPPCMEFSRQEYWSRLPFPTPRDLPDPGIKPTPPAYPLLTGGFFTTEPPGKPPWWITK